MKTVVSLQDLVDFEIRPGGPIEEFRALTESSVAALASGPLVSSPCPACRTTGAQEAFVKCGLTYRLCPACGTLYVSPRPTESALIEYTKSSAAAVFWREQILGATQQTRLEKLIRPRVDWVLETLAEHRATSSMAMDLSMQGTAFVAELAAQAPGFRTLQVGDSHGGPVAEADSLDFLTAFDVLDRAADVHALVERVRLALRPGGLFFVTAPSISGFDLQVLWDRSPTILPPDKMNLFSLEGFARLFSAPAWQVIELSTPGMFDVENVRTAMMAEPGTGWPRVMQELVLNRDETARLEFQEYLQRHRLASFARLVVRRQ